MRRLVCSFLSILAAAWLNGCSADPPADATGGAGGQGTTVSTGGPGGAAGAGGAGGAPSGPWRSSLYPEDWTPAFEDAEGRFLHDFSYAGFQYGETPPVSELPIFDVKATYGADATGRMDATPAIEQAISDAAIAGGGVVFFPAGLYRSDGVLHVTASNIVLRGEGPETSRLYFTKAAGMSDTAHVLFDAPAPIDLETPLVEDATARQTTIAVEDGSMFAPGDDIQVGFTITPEFVEAHGMTGIWKAFNGTWQPFFRRTIVAVDMASSPNVLTLDVPIRSEVTVANGATVRREQGLISNCGVESLGVSNVVAWADAWSLDRTHVIEIARAKDCFVRDVASFVSPNAPTGKGSDRHLLSGGILVRESKRVTLDHVNLGFAENRGEGGNGYLFEVRQSNEVLIQDCQGTAGRHNFIQNWGFGTTGCVFLRVESRDGKAYTDQSEGFGLGGLSEYHHSLATANLVDSSLFDDGFSAANRNGESTGAGHTSTECAFWNVRGKGTLRSLQYGWGYVIGTSELSLLTESTLPFGVGTEPYDLVEGKDRADTLSPSSLYEDQRQRRLGSN